MSKNNKIPMLLVGFYLTTLLIALCNSTEYPPPPPVPSKFANAQEVQRYLNQLHNYYTLVGRPRFGKRSKMDLDEDSTSEPEQVASNNKAKVMKMLRDLLLRRNSLKQSVF